jgi:hypothetical protein
MPPLGSRRRPISDPQPAAMGYVARTLVTHRSRSSRSARRFTTPRSRNFGLLDGIAETDWANAIDMAGAHVAVADYRPDWWPANTFLLIRRVRLDIDQISVDPRSRRRRTLHPDQRALPLDELAETDTIYGYSFILTNTDVSTPDKAGAVEYWYRHRTSIENLFRDSKHGAALRHLPSG